MKAILTISFLAKPYRKRLILVAFLILLGAIVQLFSPLVIKNIVDQIEAQITTQSGDLEVLIPLLGVLFLLNILGITLESISDRQGDAVSSRITKYLVETFYEKILKLPQTYFDTQYSAKIVNQLTRGIISIGEFIGTATNFILPSILQTILSISVLFYYSQAIGFLALLIFPFYIIVSHYSTSKWAKFELKKNLLDDTYKYRIAEVVANMKLVKIANTQLKEWKFIQKVNDQIVSYYDRQSRQYHFLNFGRNAVLELFLILIILITFKNTFNQTFSLGVMVLIIELLNQLRRPLFAMSYILERVKKADAGAKEYLSIIKLPDSETEPKANRHQLEPKPTLTLEHLSFKFDQKQILEDITLTIKPFEDIAIIGPSGAGKTTLVNLLLKLYEPQTGDIKLGKSSYKNLSHAAVRSHFAYVFQDNELFSSTVLDNISYGNGKVSQVDIDKALKAAYATDFVSDLPKGIHTKIGERGVKLSGGQKQRLQIARALLSPAPILILDEATSSLDARSESLIQQAFVNLTHQKTVITIAHRFSTLQHVDRIIVIDQGKVVDQGTPQALSNRPGIFKDLLRYQIEGNQKLLEKYDITA